MLWKKRRARKAVGCSGEHLSIAISIFSKIGTQVFTHRNQTMLAATTVQT
jgi:hypothetical protein